MGQKQLGQAETIPSCSPDKGWTLFLDSGSSWSHLHLVLDCCPGIDKTRLLRPRPARPTFLPGPAPINQWRPNLLLILVPRTLPSLSSDFLSFSCPAPKIKEKEEMVKDWSEFVRRFPLVSGINFNKLQIFHLACRNIGTKPKLLYFLTFSFCWHGVHVVLPVVLYSCHQNGILRIKSLDVCQI